MAAALLIPILAEIGVPILKSVIDAKVPGATGDIAKTVVDGIARSLGVDPTPEAIQNAYTKDPAAVADTIRKYEADTAEQLSAYLAAAGSRRDDALKVDDSKGFFYNGWRPMLSWMLIVLWACNALLIPVVNAAFNAAVPLMPYDQLLGFSGIWLTIYGGGHTIKSVFGKAN